jgi:hypothetical protein
MDASGSESAKSVIDYPAWREIAGEDARSRDDITSRKLSGVNPFSRTGAYFAWWHEGSLTVSQQGMIGLRIR